MVTWHERRVLPIVVLFTIALHDLSTGQTPEGAGGGGQNQLHGVPGCCASMKSKNSQWDGRTTSCSCSSIAVPLDDTTSGSGKPLFRSSAASSAVSAWHRRPRLSGCLNCGDTKSHRVAQSRTELEKPLLPITGPLELPRHVQTRVLWNHYGGSSSYEEFCYRQHDLLQVVHGHPIRCCGCDSRSKSTLEVKRNYDLSSSEKLC